MPPDTIRRSGGPHRRRGALGLAARGGLVVLKDTDATAAAAGDFLG